MTAYPIEVHVERSTPRSRLWAILAILTFKLWALIPHFIVLFFLNIARFVVFVIAQFAVLFTGRYPEGMHGFVAAVIRWEVRVWGFLLSLTDRYPPFSLREGGHPVDLTARHPERSSRIFAAFTLLLLLATWVGIGLATAYAHAGYWNQGGSGPGGWLNLRYIAALPHLIILAFFAVAVFVVWVITQFVILFVGRTNRGMDHFMEMYTRWWGRVQGFIHGLTDRYPPFSGEPGPSEEAALRTDAGPTGEASGGRPGGSPEVPPVGPPTGQPALAGGLAGPPTGQPPHGTPTPGSPPPEPGARPGEGDREVA